MTAYYKILFGGREALQYVFGNTIGINSADGIPEQQQPQIF